MEHIDDVECIHDGPWGVRSCGRVRCEVDRISKVEDGRSLDGDVDELVPCVCNRIVATSGESQDAGALIVK